MLIGNTQERMHRYFFGKPFHSLIWGMLVTGAVQSSSVTTSLLVPLVAKGKVDPKKAFCFVMGANLGTTITALFAAFSISPLGMSIAIAHILFNLFGILIIYPIPAIRYLPVNLARMLGIATEKNRLVGFLYLLLTFFVIPFLLIYFTRK
jgi:sodium-dependent phosphate cotransporter